MEAKMEEDDESTHVCRATQTDSKAFLCEHFTTNHKKVHSEEGRVWSDLVLWFQSETSSKDKCLPKSALTKKTHFTMSSGLMRTLSSWYIPAQTMRVKIGREHGLKPQAKHAFKVHIWTAISRRGATHICVFHQNMDGPLHVSILEKFLSPFLMEIFPDGHYQFMQHSDPKQTVLLMWPRTFMLRRKSVGGKHPQAVWTSTRKAFYCYSWPLSKKRADGRNVSVLASEDVTWKVLHVHWPHLLSSAIDCGQRRRHHRRMILLIVHTKLYMSS